MERIESAIATAYDPVYQRVTQAGAGLYRIAQSAWRDEKKFRCELREIPADIRTKAQGGSAGEFVAFVAEEAEAGVDDGGVVEAAAVGFDFSEGEDDAGGDAVGAVGAHGFDDVGYGDDAGLKDDGLCGEAAGIAGAVEALVVLEDDVADGPGELDVLDDGVAEVNVLLDDFELGAAEAAGLGEELEGDADLAEVVDAGAEVEAVDAVFREAEQAADADAEVGDAALMAAGVGIALVDGFRDDLDGLLEADAEVVLVAIFSDFVAEGVDAEAEIEGDLLHEAAFGVGPGAVLRAVGGEAAAAAIHEPEGQGDGGVVTALEGLIAPWLHAGIGGEVLGDLNLSCADGAASGTAAGIDVAPGDADVVEVAFFKAEVGDGNDGPARLVLCKADPGHAIAAGFDEDAAVLGEQVLFGLGAESGGVDGAEELNLADVAGELGFHALLLGDVLEGAEELDDAALGVADDGAAGAGPAQRAVRADDFDFDVVGLAGGEGTLDGSLDALPALRGVQGGSLGAVGRGRRGIAAGDLVEACGPEGGVGFDIPAGAAGESQGFSLFEDVAVGAELFEGAFETGDVGGGDGDGGGGIFVEDGTEGELKPAAVGQEQLCAEGAVSEGAGKLGRPERGLIGAGGIVGQGAGLGWNAEGVEHGGGGLIEREQAAAWVDGPERGFDGVSQGGERRRGTLAESSRRNTFQGPLRVRHRGSPLHAPWPHDCTTGFAVRGTTKM